MWVHLTYKTSIDRYVRELYFFYTIWSVAIISLQSQHQYTGDIRLITLFYGDDTRHFWANRAATEPMQFKEESFLKTEIWSVLSYSLQIMIGNQIFDNFISHYVWAIKPHRSQIKIIYKPLLRWIGWLIFDMSSHLSTIKRPESGKYNPICYIWCSGDLADNYTHPV